MIPSIKLTAESCKRFLSCFRRRRRRRGVVVRVMEHALKNVRPLVHPPLSVLSLPFLRVFNLRDRNNGTGIRVYKLAFINYF